MSKGRQFTCSLVSGACEMPAPRHWLFAELRMRHIELHVSAKVFVRVREGQPRFHPAAVMLFPTPFASSGAQPFCCY